MIKNYTCVSHICNWRGDKRQIVLTKNEKQFISIEHQLLYSIQMFNRCKNDHFQMCHARWYTLGDKSDLLVFYIGPKMD